MSSNILLFLDFSINVINDRREKLRECRLNFTSAGNHVIIKVLKKKTFPRPCCHMFLFIMTQPLCYN